MNIGILEDNTTIHEYLKFVLERAGHAPFFHTDALSLLDGLFPEQSIPHLLPYDMLIVDLCLPGTLSAFDVIDYLRQTTPPHILPILVVSAASTRQLGQVRMRFPDIQVLQKPCPPKTLLRCIEAIRAGEAP